jgi:hypothetical protein
MSSVSPSSTSLSASSLTDDVYILKKKRPGCTGMFWRSDPTGQTPLSSQSENWPRDDAKLRGTVVEYKGEKWLKASQVQQVKNLFESGQYKKSLGFKIPRRLFIGKQLVKYGGFYPDYQLRLFEKGFGRFQDLPVHESVELWDETRQDYVTKNSFTDIFSKFFNPKLKRKIIKNLNYALDHYSYNSIEELEAAFMNYARLSNKKASSIFASLKAVYAFFYKYFIRAGILDGSLGLQLAFINAKYTYSKYQKN